MCNAEWRWQRWDSACVYCNRLWYTSSPCLLAWGLNLNLPLVILLFLGEGTTVFWINSVSMSTVGR